MAHFVRISRDYNALAGLLEIVRNECDVLVVYEHEQDEEVSRTHVHFYIEGFTLTIQALKDRVRKHLLEDKFPKGDWSFKEKNKDGSSVNPQCITYMSKGDLTPKMVKGISREEIDAYTSQWVERPKGTKYQTRLAFTTRETPAEAKKRKNDLIKEMMLALEEFKQTKDFVNDLGNIYYYPSQSCLEVIVRVLNENNQVFGRYQVRDYYDTIMSRLNTKDFIGSLRSICTFQKQ